MVHKKLLFSGKEYSEHRKYWSEKLSDEGTFIFKGSGHHSPKDSFKTTSILLKDENISLLGKYTEHRDLETFIFLLSGLYILLHKYNHQRININSPVNKVDGEIWEPAVSLFQHVIPDDSIKDLIKKVNSEVLTSYKFQNFPLDLLSDKSIIEKGPLSNVLVVYPEIHSIEMVKEESYDLQFYFIKRQYNQIEISVNYREGLFQELFINSLLKHYEAVLSSFQNLNAPIRAIEILSDEEQKRIKFDFNHTKFSYPTGKRVVELFEEQAAKTPNHIALISGDKKITYNELNERSNSLAHYLSSKYDIQPNTFIGSLFEKSEYAIISLLAILKSGAAYIALDPESPPERIYHIIKDASLDILLTVSDNLFSYEQYSGHLLALDIQDEIFSGPTQNLNKEYKTSDVAYLIYTSGSSGKPKGVVIEHEGLVNVALDHIQEFQMKETDVYLLFMSLSFDGSLLDIFTAILSGATLLLPSRKTINNVEAFIETVRENKVSVTTLTPSYLSSLNKDLLPSIRILVSAGEAAKVEDALYYSKFKDFYNGYGPSETTVNVTLHKVDPAIEYSSIPIGKPRANKEVYILNENNHLLPIGITGEICVGGVGLAREYLNDPELTNQKFIPSPFNLGERLYKTGDLGYWHQDGNIEYVGRNDEQVKINGFRIDLGEIEKNLINHRNIRNAVVINNKNGEASEKGLIAYYEKDSKVELVPSLGEYFIYDSFIYNSMAKDEMRVTGYKSALKDVVRDKVVLDPGTGPEMILARHCVEAGARKVYAVEIDAEAYQTAQENVVKYSLEDKIVLMFGDIKDIVLPEKIDYVISALAGNMASSDGCIPMINHFKKHIGYDVNFVPNQYTTFIAATTLPEDAFEYAISDISQHYINKVFDKFGYSFDLRFCLKNFSPDKIISESGVCESINYAETLEAEDEVFLHLLITKRGKINGLVSWINAFSGEMLMIDSLKKTHHLPVYFPLFEEGVEVNPGDVVEFTFCRKLSDNGLNPDYFVEGKISRNGDSDVPFKFSSYNHKNSFRASPMYEKLFKPNGEVIKLEKMNDQNLKEYLSKVLPYYMLPKKYFPIDSFKLNANGKVDKAALLNLLEQTSKEKESIVPPETHIEKLLCQIWESVLGGKIGIKDDFFMLGGDSIKAIQIASRLHKEGYHVEVKDIFAHPVLMNLAKSIKPYAGTISQSRVSGNVPLTPVQKDFLSSGYSNISHYNQAVLLTAEQFDVDALKAAFNKILDHHDALRITFSKQLDGNLIQINNDSCRPVEIEEVDLRKDSEAFTTFTSKANELQRKIDLESGPLLKLALFHFKECDYLLIIIHHFVVDGVSWRILFEDIDILYKQYKNGQGLELSLKTDSFKRWAEELGNYAQSSILLKEIDYWQSIDEVDVPVINKELNATENYIRDNERLTFKLDESVTELLITKVNSAFGTEINDILLTALAIAINETFGNEKVLVVLEGHGREEVIKDINISRTVGWFTSAYPVLLNTNREQSLSKTIREIKDSIHRVPNKGIGYGILKHLTDPSLKQSLNFKTAPQISFNYLGQFDEDVKDTFFQISAGSVGQTLSPDEQRRFDFDFSGMIADGCFISTLYYNKNHYHLETIEKLMENYKNSLQEIIHYCSSQAEAVLTPTDFTYKELKMEDLDIIFD